MQGKCPRPDRCMLVIQTPNEAVLDAWYHDVRRYTNTISRYSREDWFTVDGPPLAIAYFHVIFSGLEKYNDQVKILPQKQNGHPPEPGLRGVSAQPQQHEEPLPKPRILGLTYSELAYALKRIVRRFWA